MHNITLVVGSSEKHFRCGEQEDILRAAMRAGVFDIPIGCCNGGCGMCKVLVVDGDFERGLCSMAVLDDSDREQRYSLACKTYPKTGIRLIAPFRGAGKKI
ncbi:2Fe-2S iron-sulfur cluster-binding protein [Ferviditalea candida]|uniref:2Fe-2S iron-sulfur cluster-binding protein n=1 Tax=Ferviditalea candida TaxID=3108399 RepID=A0ABU5ZCM1_9BACL|nr:2Fe-2S iron-sulfur cluster-binding protein [Paenibacillaceae bacterium T2]